MMIRENVEFQNREGVLIFLLFSVLKNYGQR